MPLTISLCLLALLMVGIRMVAAHASLDGAFPAANSTLDTPPDEIRLWFTEPLEPAFSQITLRDGDGSPVPMPAAAVDAEDTYQLVAQPERLPNGVYTVVWRVVSAADGHSTNGSYPFSIGVPLTSAAASEAESTAIPREASAVRWTHLLYLSLLVGGLGFVVIVWLPGELRAQIAADRALQSLLVVVWLLLGVTTIAMLLLQTSISAGIPILSAITHPALGQILSETRYGGLWLLQAALWWVAGGLIIGTHSGQRRYQAAFVVGLGLLLVQSLYSHASAAENNTAAIAMDWLHLTAASLWFGGLVGLVQVIVLTRRQGADAPVRLSRLVARFSNIARLCVVVLLLSGIFQGLLHVGSVEALLTTVYGQALVVKLVVILPLLVIAFINFRFTGRRLAAGQTIWAGRLQTLVGIEIAVITGVLITVGVMTSIAPARTVLAERVEAAKAKAVQATANLSETQTREGLTLTLTVAPAAVGVNTFALALSDADGLVEDATVVRMRFNHMRENLGESELRPEHGGGGVYAIEGANLSIPGDWRLRVSVARPGAFDVVTTFNLTVPAPTP